MSVYGNAKLVLQNVEDPRFQALAKQLSQLDATSSKIEETLRFISEFNQDNGGSVLGSHAPQHLQHLQQLRQRLKDAVGEIDQIQGLSLPSQFPSPDKAAATGAGEAMDILNADGSRSQMSGRISSSAIQSPATGGAVTGKVSRLTQQAAEESAIALARVKDEQRRLKALEREIADLQRDNEAMSQDLSSRDIRGLREQVAAQQAQLREAREAEEELRQLMELSTRLPRIQTEVEGLRAAVSGVDALQRELEELRETDVRRVKLFREISAFQAKVSLIEKMEVRAKELEAEVQRGESLQARVAELQVEADKLPALRSRMFILQAGAAEARQLEKLMTDYGKQEVLLQRLKDQEQEVQARASGIEDLRTRIEMLKLSASEADQLEVKFASLASSVSRLPLLRSQVGQLEEKCDELEHLQTEKERLEKVEEECNTLRRQVEELRPKAEALEALRSEVETMQRAAIEAEGMRATTREEVSTGTIPRSDDSVQATAKSFFEVHRSLSLSLSPMQARHHEAEHLGSEVPSSSPRDSLRIPHVPAEQSEVHISPGLPPPEPASLLPEGVSAKLARQRAEVEALEQAEAELRDLGTLRERLQAQVEALRSSKVAAEVVYLQTQLMELQGREMQQLSAEVAGLADASSRLESLRKQHEILEREADEAFVLQSQLPDLEEAAAQVGMLRRRHNALQAEISQIKALGDEIVQAEAALSSRPALEARLHALDLQQREVDLLTARLQEAPAVEEKLERLKKQYDDMQAKAMQADRMTEELSSLRLQMMQVATPIKSKSCQVVPRSYPLVPNGDGVDSPAVEGDWHIVDASPIASTRAAGNGRDDEEGDRMLSMHLGQVRAQHAALVAQREELLRLTAESHLLLKDNDVLRMQLNVAVSLYGGEAMSAGGPLVMEADLNPSMEGTAGEAAGNEGCSQEGKMASPANTLEKPLEVVFQRMRALESQNMGLTARNTELQSEAEYLHTALEASLNRLEAFKGLAATVGMIRGKNASSRSLNQDG